MTSDLCVIGRDWSAPIRETRSSLENPQTPLSYPAEWLLDMFNGGRTDSGIRVSELTAFQASTFLTCVDLIAGKISSFQRHVYERSLNKHGRAVHRIAYEHDYYDLIALEPNEEMSAQTILKAFLCHCLAWGNGYQEIQRDAGNQAVALWPRNPDKTHARRVTTAVRIEPEPWRPFPVTLEPGELVFETTDWTSDQDHSDPGAHAARPQRLIPKEDMIYVPGISFDGRVGQSVVWLARQTLGLALATEKFGAKYFANFAKPGGILEVPQQRKEDRDKTRESWLEAQGGENSHRVAVMPIGVKWTPMSNNPKDSMSIEAQALIRSQLAALFHIPNRLVGDAAKSSRASTEQENQEVLDFAFAPWINAIKLEYKRKLFPHPKVGRRPNSPFYVDFDVSDMIRGDAASREKFNASGKMWGYLNTNDVRGLEKLNPLDEDWAEEYWMPVNQTLATTPINPNHQDGAGNGDVPSEGEKPHAS